MTSSLPDTVFITGATGFIGSHIARRYLAAGRAVEALYRPASGYGLLTDVADRITWHEGDITDIPSLQAAIRPGMAVIHAAAIVSFVPKDRPRMEKINVEGTANVVNVCLQAGIRKLGYISSVAALGRPSPKGIIPGQSIVINENQKWEESPHNSFYAQTKYRAELEVWRGVAEGLNVVMVNPSVVLGEGDWTRSSVQLFKYVYDEKPFYTDGTINFVDVKDVADAVYELMQTEIVNGRFILNAGTLPYKELLEQMATAMGKRPPRVRVSPAVANILWRLEAVRSWFTGKPPLITKETARSASQSYRFDNRKLMQMLDFHYRPLDETLRRVATALKGS
ncbi:NAD-dependent epimerase/dehydratase family protein [Nibrella saemangeumensis]|uniref:NAD-dependent epimerase/dehydratase family protein n=1 Tax=Nibrella saemangeumensis TaxID=1084526 RepID=A0ABP8M7J7_9BACT